MNQFLAISILGAERSGLLRDITRAALDSGCTIRDSRMILLGETFSLQLLASGPWDAVARLESALPRLGAKLDLTVHSRRTNERPGKQDRIPYAVDAIAANQAGIVHNLASFFAERNTDVLELSSRAYPAPQTHATLFALQLIVAIPINTSIATLREEFMDLCDHVNIDAVLEPMKN